MPKKCWTKQLLVTSGMILTRGGLQFKRLRKLCAGCWTQDAHSEQLDWQSRLCKPQFGPRSAQVRVVAIAAAGTIDSLVAPQLWVAMQQTTCRGGSALITLALTVSHVVNHGFFAASVSRSIWNISGTLDVSGNQRNLIYFDIGQIRESDIWYMGNSDSSGSSDPGVIRDSGSTRFPDESDMSDVRVFSISGYIRTSDMSDISKSPANPIYYSLSNSHSAIGVSSYYSTDWWH